MDKVDYKKPRMCFYCDKEIQSSYYARHIREKHLDGKIQKTKTIKKIQKVDNINDGFMPGFKKGNKNATFWKCAICTRIMSTDEQKTPICQIRSSTKS